MFKIYDWAGNLKFGGAAFETFEEAWAHIYEHVPNEEDYQEYHVMEVV